MPTLNDILTANGDYTPVSGYPVDDKYENDSPVINVYDRTIGEIVGDTSTSGENVSQYLTFRIPRHPDHYDLIENGTNIRILYRLEDDTGEDVVPVNVIANEDYIIFGWKIPLVVTVNPGVVTFIIHAYKSENNIITYHYKTLPKTYMILETMETDVVVPEIEMYNLAEAYARGTITDVFGQTRPVEEGDPGYHDNSKYYKELAGTSKIDAETAKNAAEVAQKAAETAKQAAEDARDQAVAIVGGEYVSYGQTQSLNDTQKNKARENIGATEPNGYYPNMTVGLSENFVGTGEPTRRIFNYDTAGGSADISDGNAEIDKIVGGTVAWNQYVPNFVTNNGYTFDRCTGAFSNSVATLTVNADGATAGRATIFNEDTIRVPVPIALHKYFLTCCVNPSVAVDYTTIIFGNGNSKSKSGLTVNAWNLVEGVSTFSTPSGHYVQVDVYGTLSVGDTVQVKNFMVFDLTQMFGSTTADYIYSLEQSQAGAGVSWFKKLFPLDYYPYDEGTLLNVNPAGIKTVGFNAYDKATGKAELIGGNQYQITGTYTSLSYSTGEVLTPDSTGCFTPTKTGELTVTGGGENTCVHLTWSGYRNGDYEDYWARTRDINIQPYFPDGLKRAGTVYDEISKDKAIKRIGVVDLGTLDWTKVEESRLSVGYLFAALPPTNAKENDLNRLLTIYPFANNALGLTEVINKYGSDIDKLSWSAFSSGVYIVDSTYTDAATFKSAMSGVMLYYELATPVETQIDPPLNLLYQVSDFGTEQFLGAGATEPKTLPIIADIVYGVNYRDTIKNLPKNYAKVRGYYPDLYTGLADNLIDRKGNGTPQEISYRTSCGDDSIADDGNGIIQSIFGNTVVWNQLAKPINTTNWAAEANHVTATITDGEIVFSSDTTGFGVYQNRAPVSKSHIYYFSLVAKGASAGSIRFLAGSEYGVAKEFSVQTTETVYQGLVKTNDQSEGWFFIAAGINGTDIEYTCKDVRIFDLTQMFGAGNEPSTLDDPRIKWNKDYANDHPEYNSGELISYNGNGIKTVGFNQWDEEWENGTIDSNGILYDRPNCIRSKNYNRCIGGATYYLHCGSATNPYFVRLIFYDANKNRASDTANWTTNTTVTAPSDACYFKVATQDAETARYGGTYNHDICINLSWSGYRNGEYEPYWSRILNLPISTYFPDGMKSAGSVRDELTKDKAVKRIGVVDLGSLSWGRYIDGAGYFAVPEADIPLKPKRPVSSSTKANAICSKYMVEPTNKIYLQGFIDKTIGIHTNGSIIAQDTTYTDATTFKAAMSGVMLYYELAEPIETTITPPLDLTYKVADFGTEESIAEGKSTPFIGIIKYSDDFTRALVNMPKNYDTTASLDALAASLSAMLTSALDGTVTITRGEYDPATKKYEWSCQFTKNQVN